MESCSGRCIRAHGCLIRPCLSYVLLQCYNAIYMSLHVSESVSELGRYDGLIRCRLQRPSLLVLMATKQFVLHFRRERVGNGCAK